VPVYTNFSTRAACGCVRDGKIRYVRRCEATVTKCAVVEDQNRGATITLSFHYIRQLNESCRYNMLRNRCAYINKVVILPAFEATLDN